MQRYAITDRRSLGESWLAGLVLQMERWVAGGVEWVQLREKDLPLHELAALTHALARGARVPGSRTRLVVNLGGGGSAKDVLAWGADGVHLPGGASVEAVRAALRLAASGGCVSVSCHSLAAVREGASGREAGAGSAAVLWGPVFGKTLSGELVTPGSGLNALGAACVEAGPVPVFALGGVTAENAQACVRAGAAGVAGIRLFAEERWRELR